MQQYLFPGIFIKEEDSSYTAFIPDLNLTAEGDTIEEAYLYIQDFLSIYCSYCKKMGEEETLMPTKYEEIAKNNSSKIVMLIDAFV